MYSIVSWSPSQSAPLTVSYMCQRQSSSPMLPSAAAMPPCAATVCERVGNTLVMQAVLSPASAQPTTARRPEPRAPLAVCRLPPSLQSEINLQDRVTRSDADREGEEGIGHQQQDFSQLRMHVILDDHLHADPHM